MTEGTSDNDETIVPVILSGGSGTRLWPISTEDRPKQFLELLGHQTLFQLTLQRCNDERLFDPPTIVGSIAHHQLLTNQMDEIGIDAGNIILEPCARNTAPAIALAALACDNPQSLMLVMPSDHIIKNVDMFQETVRQSIALAKARWLVTFGINPTGPETGYGYIQQGDEIFGSVGSFAARCFVEKPNSENAEKMISDGGYYWNSGIFLFRADSYLAALELHAPEMLVAAKQAMKNAEYKGIEIHPDEASFATAPSDSIDYAIMERADKVAITPVNPGWSDVGSWDSLYEVSVKDEQSNNEKGDVVAVNSTGNLIQSDDLKIVTYGLEDMIVIAKGKTVMIIPRGQSQNVKKILEQLKQDD
ncbi:Mannose-1-phosphate guanylyltransferase / Mannose-6-phosphate isomerase [hydrothermal vent metagenome]|uniref:Mannose-1-phosphate guanylyltransferase / Mannose-6-phosphate isomerase n=1 Tax=hydrothermal vent metagenome TaxID=652676 RepID=A0A3B0RWK1_9ZZZZ